MAQDAIRAALEAVLAELGVEDAHIGLERPRDPTHGDLATNVALTLAKRLGRPPRDIAEEIADRLDLEAAGVTAVEVAGPGFLNFRLSSGTVASALETILDADEASGARDVGKGERVMVEFVSANPTGPLHLGHGRQAALGDAIASLLDWTGWKVHREFYYNDAGLQMDRLAESVRARYQELHGRSAEIPEGGYQGEYVRDIAQRFARSRRGPLGGRRLRTRRWTPCAASPWTCCAPSRTATWASSASTSTSTSSSRRSTTTGRWRRPSRRCGRPATSTSGTARPGCAPPSSGTRRTG